MIRYQLKTGKTVLLTNDQFLDMTDEDEQSLMAQDAGIDVEDPFSDFKATTPREIPDIDIEDIPDEIKKEIEKDFES